jgi:serine/threonine-protein kinase
MRTQPAPSELIGTIVGGYRLERRLGSGALANVYLGRHMRLGRAAAVKVLHAQHVLDEEVASRFFCEARAVAEISNPHLVEIYDFVFEPKKGRVAYTMELLVGEDLRKILDRKKPLPPDRAARIAAQLCDGLEAAHEHGVVHRDVRPANIMVVRRGGQAEYVKLLDFGVAQFEGPVKHHTAAGKVLGDPQYMSPEAARGQRVDGRADVYSVGILLHEMLTGSPPFSAPTLAETIAMHLHRKPPSVQGDHGAGMVSRELADIVRECLQKSPDDRPLDAASLRAALLDYACTPDVDRTQSVRRPPQDDNLSARFRRQALRLRGSRAAALIAGSTAGMAAGYWLAIALR